MAVILGMLAAPAAKASITIDMSGVAADTALGIGWIAPKIDPSSLDGNSTDLNRVITAYNTDTALTVGSTHFNPYNSTIFGQLTTPGIMPASHTSLSGTNVSISLPMNTSYLYLVAQWGTTVDAVYYIGDIEAGSTFFLQNNDPITGFHRVGGPPYSLSDVWFANPTVTVVPEPATLLAGALLLLPFGANTVRILRNKRTS